MIPSSSPNAAQKRWMEAVRAQGSIISGGPAVIHHVVGRTAKHNKVAIGHWWILPLTDDEHKLLHSDKAAFDLQWLCADQNRWFVEKEMFQLVMDKLHPESIEMVPEDVYDAIWGYHR